MVTEMQYLGLRVGIDGAAVSIEGAAVDGVEVGNIDINGAAVDGTNVDGRCSRRYNS